MKACVAEINGKPVYLELKDGAAYLDGQPIAIKNLEEKELSDFNEEIAGLPKSDDPGYPALVNAVRASFIASLLGKAAGDESVDKLSHILDQVHYDVLEYLGEPDGGNN